MIKEATSTVLLEAKNIRRSFGGVVAVNDVSFKIHEGQIKAIIGPNGAGKTTLFNLISGVIRPDQGDVLFKGKPITGSKPHQIARRGISRTFQNVSLFLNMTVLENVMIGRHTRTHKGFFASALRLPGQPAEERAIKVAAMECLDFVGLKEAASLLASALPFGKRRMVELARAMATSPALLLLDEPASGLNTSETADLAKLILKIRDSGITVLLVEHDMSLVMDISDDILVLNFGTPIADGSPTEVRNDPHVVAIYLGGDFNDA